MVGVPKSRGCEVCRKRKIKVRKHFNTLTFAFQPPDLDSGRLASQAFGQEYYLPHALDITSPFIPRSAVPLCHLISPCRSTIFLLIVSPSVKNPRIPCACTCPLSYPGTHSHICITDTRTLSIVWRGTPRLYPMHQRQPSMSRLHLPPKIPRRRTATKKTLQHQRQQTSLSSSARSSNK